MNRTTETRPAPAHATRPPCVPTPVHKRSMSVRRRRRIRPVANPRERHAYWELRVFYDGGPNAQIDNRISKAVGKPSLGSGCMLSGKMTRDWLWEFTKPNLATAAARRVLRAVQSGFREDGIKTKVRTEVWDTKPRQIFRDGAPQ